MTFAKTNEIYATNKNHKRFKHKPTMREILRSKLLKAQDICDNAFEEYAILREEEGYNASETVEAYEYYTQCLEKRDNAYEAFNDFENRIGKSDYECDDIIETNFANKSQQRRKL